MYILIVSHGIPSDKNPQWGCFELDQAKALSKLGHRVVIIALDGRFRMQFRHVGISYSTPEGIDAYLFYLIPLTLIPFEQWRNKVRAKMMRRLFHRVVGNYGYPDVIYAHYMLRMVSLSLVKKENPSIPIVGIEHWSELSRPHLSKTLMLCGQEAYRVADRLLAVSPNLQAQIKKHFGKDSEVVYDMVGDAFLEAPIKLKKTWTPFRFVSVGSLIDGKGFDVLIQAFSKLSNQRTELYIVGDGPAKESLSLLCKRLGIEDRVFLKGLLPHEEIVTILFGANAYVLASRSETFGVSYVEAMAMGLPAIATRCGGPEAFMSERCGQMVDVGDVEGLTAAMDRMTETASSYDAEELREYIRSRFSGEVIAKQLERIFEEEIKAKKE